VRSWIARNRGLRTKQGWEFDRIRTPAKLLPMTNNTRRFEMVEGASSKFWQISIEGSSFTVTYGRIGTAGTSKTTACTSPEAAKTEADKLIAEKTRKGYIEQGGSAPKDTFRPPVEIDIMDHAARYLNYKVTNFVVGDGGDGDDEGGRSYGALRDLDKRVFRVGISYDDDAADFTARLDALLADKKLGELRGLVIGQWYGDYCDKGPNAMCEKLLANAAKLTSLKGLFVGDIVQEESEVSWIHQCDYGPLLSALPQLEDLVIRGGENLRFSKLKNSTLRSILLQTGGLSKKTLKDLFSAELPSLQTLRLWLGVDDYGGDGTVKDLAPILSGKLFPQLTYLGLQDCKYSDDIAKAVAKAPILERLKGLDLSMGTLSDEGAKVLIDTPAIRNLKYLNLRHHYMSKEMVKKIRELGIEVNVGDQRTARDDERYPEVTE